MSGPVTEFSQQLFKEKYAEKGESHTQAMHRIAKYSGLSKSSKKDFQDFLCDMAILPAGRIQAAFGGTKEITPFNCFVSGTIQDSLVEEPGCIMDSLKEAATTLRLGGGVGYDFSTLRPRDAWISKLQSTASGPISFMKVFDASCRTIHSAGHRRGAQMGILRVDHPDIREFIRIKHNNDQLTSFNLSVAVTDKFMRAVEENTPFDLVFNGIVYETVSARNLWDEIIHSTWDWAEPGVIFIDRINRDNNLWYCERIAASNPCSEQFLPPYGVCLLSSLNLVKFVREDKTFEWAKFQRAAELTVQFLNTVIDTSLYPLDAQLITHHNNRRMGVGVTGVANALEFMGYPYGEEAFVYKLDEVMASLQEATYMTSVMLAKTDGPFPQFDRKLYLQSGYMSRVPSHIRRQIETYGIRNSHLISVQPTGTISLVADNVSSGIEPVFQPVMNRDVFFSDGKRTVEVSDYGYKFLGVKGKTVDQVTVAEHLSVMATTQRYCDSAVSKTINVGSETSFKQFKNVYSDAYELGLKSVATFRVDGKRFAMMSKAVGDATPSSPETLACFIDPTTGVKTCAE